MPACSPRKLWTNVRSCLSTHPGCVHLTVQNLHNSSIHHLHPVLTAHHNAPQAAGGLEQVLSVHVDMLHLFPSRTWPLKLRLPAARVPTSYIHVQPGQCSQ